MREESWIRRGESKFSHFWVSREDLVIKAGKVELSEVEIDKFLTRVNEVEAFQRKKKGEREKRLLENFNLSVILIIIINVFEIISINVRFVISSVDCQSVWEEFVSDGFSN